MSAHGDMLKKLLVTKKGTTANTKATKAASATMKQLKRVVSTAPVAKVTRGASRGS